MALWLKGIGARFLIEIMRVRVAPGLPISLRDRLNGRTAGFLGRVDARRARTPQPATLTDRERRLYRGFDPADLGSNPSPSANLVQVSGVNG